MSRHAPVSRSVLAVVVSLLLVLVLAPTVPAGAEGRVPGGRGPDDGVADPVLPPPTFQTVSQEALVPMDDGVRLAVTIVRPSHDGEVPAPGRYPVVLAMTPYGRNGVCGCFPPALFAQRGMVAVVADVRGTGGSEGDLSENYFSPREARDGAALAEHFGAQPYSTGRVGMAGGSYVGITQYLVAAQQPDHLAAIAPMLAISDLYRDGFAHGGVPNILFDLQYLAVQGAPGYVGVNTDPSLLAETLAAKLGQSPPGAVALDYLSRPTDGPFYRDRSPITGADRIQVPVLDIGAWRDGLLRGQTEMYTALANRPGVETRLHMDPCTHKGCGAPFAPTTDPPDRVALDALVFEFLDGHLRDADTPDRAPVEYYLQGRDEYRTARQWPPADVRYRRLAFAPDGTLVASPRRPGPSRRPRGEPAVGTPSPTASYVAHPAAGLAETFSRYGTVGITPYLPLDQRLEGPHGLTFRTGRLDQPMALVGPIAVHLVAASTATDTDWHVKLADVAPDGSESLITTGALRASHRALDPDRSTPRRPYHTHVDPQPIEPGRFVAYEIEVWPTAYELPAGHRLQLRLTSTDLPTHAPAWVDVDPEHPEDADVHVHDPAVNTVRLLDSHVRLPVLAATGRRPVDLPHPAAGRVPEGHR